MLNDAEITNWKTYSGQTRGLLECGIGREAEAPDDHPDLLDEHDAAPVECVGDRAADDRQREQRDEVRQRDQPTASVDPVSW